MTISRMTARFLAAGGLILAAAGPACASERGGLRMEEILDQLSNPNFEIRARAEKELGGAGIAEVEALREAAMGNAEHAARVVAVLERLFVGASDRAPAQALARSACLSPAADAALTLRRIGDFNETETTLAAEQALEFLKRSDSAAAVYAAAALSRHRLLVENRAISAIRADGGRVIFSDNLDPMNMAISRFLWDPRSGVGTRTSAVEPRVINHVILLPEWKSGAAGLENLRRLQPIGPVMLFAVEGCGVSADDVARGLRSDYPFDYHSRSPATLGVSSSTIISGPCQISGVTEGLAADLAGLRSGEIIEAMDGEPIRDFEELVERLKSYKPGDKITLTLTTSGFTNSLELDPLRLAEPRQRRETSVTLSSWSQLPDFPPSSRSGR